MKNRVSFAALLATTAFLTAPALAQSTVEDHSVSEKHGGDIIVTAQKIEQRATDVPITAAVRTVAGGAHASIQSRER